jgi:hypothetical protein
MKEDRDVEFSQHTVPVAHKQKDSMTPPYSRKNSDGDIDIDISMLLLKL